MIKWPEEIRGMTDYDEEDNWVLKEGATEKQKQVFEEFKKELESGELTDVVVTIE